MTRKSAYSTNSGCRWMPSREDEQIADLKQEIKMLRGLLKTQGQMINAFAAQLAALLGTDEEGR